MNVPINELRKLVRAERWADLIALLTGVSEKNEISVEVALAAYKAHARTNNSAAAEYWLNRALALTPANPTLLRDKGIFHQKRQEWLEASACFENASRLRPEIASYHGLLGYARYQNGNYADAAESFKAALAIDDTNRGWWIRLARSHVHTNALYDAVDAYKSALKLKDDASSRSAHDELLRQISSGSRAASPAYYDAIYSTSEKYQVSGGNSEYAPVWQRIVEALNINGTTRILDLGCGPGQFAEFIASKLPSVVYTGLDFSGVAILNARQRCPNFVFEEQEFPIRNFDTLPSFDTVICTEVLEHIEEDRELLEALPENTFVIASVPNFDSFGHLRVFRSEDEVRERYCSLFDNLAIHGVAISEQNTIWLIQGHRSGGTHGIANFGATPEAQKKVAAPDTHACEAIHGKKITVNNFDMRLAHQLETRYGQPDMVMKGKATISSYRGLLDIIRSSSRNNCTMLDLSATRENNAFCLRHDVDHSIEHAVIMGMIEAQMGLVSSFYFLPPGDYDSPINYYGEICDGRIRHSQRLVEAAKILSGLGHEIGLHNDFVQLSVLTRRSIEDILIEEIEFFASLGISVKGTASHGSTFVRKNGFVNYDIFSDLDGKKRNDGRRAMRIDDVEINLSAISMGSVGLSYEAYFTPYDLYLSDVGSGFSVSSRTDQSISYNVQNYDQVNLEEVSRQLDLSRGALVCLTHPEWWKVSR